MEKLFSMAEEAKKNNIDILLIQIDEAHSSAWPMAIPELLGVDKVEPHKTFEGRVKRANYFVNEYNPPFPVYIDTWSNTFSDLFRAWPDKYHCINKNFEVVAKSEYHSKGEKEAVIIEDCTLVLERLFVKSV